MLRRGNLVAVMLLSGLTLTACGSDSQDNAQPSAAKDSVSPQASPSPTPSATIPSPTSTDTSVESLGEQMGAKIAFYAVAKAAGMTESAKMDELAAGICSRIGAGKPEDVGPWMKDTFKLEGDVAAKVAVTAIEVQCPEFKSKMGL
ncbi:hypothetical protein GCM10011314_33720 [Knoellia flava]|uniref:DUF732 domain-containing protein n=2 Tax=Knoellia flava TaxID=913969 RepID=A0A8H9FXC4_9MICO|nr:hypothetical protein GCM10011314_33720 [Knoellia flava]